MDNKIFISASDVAKAMDISIGHAYKLVRQMNDELKKSGFIVVAGKVPYAYFRKKIFGFNEGNI